MEKERGEREIQRGTKRQGLPHMDQPSQNYQIKRDIFIFITSISFTLLQFNYIHFLPCFMSFDVQSINPVSQVELILDRIWLI